MSHDQMMDMIMDQVAADECADHDIRTGATTHAVSWAGAL